MERPNDPEDWYRRVRPNTRLFYGEAIPDPKNDLIDIEAIADAAHANNVPFAIDSTLTTPTCSGRIDFGADIVLHSTSKFLAGHGNSIGGVVVDAGRFDWAAHPDRYPHLHEPIHAGTGDRTTWIDKFGAKANFAFTRAVVAGRRAPARRRSMRSSSSRASRRSRSGWTGTRGTHSLWPRGWNSSPKWPVWTTRGCSPTRLTRWRRSTFPAARVRCCLHPRRRRDAAKTFYNAVEVFTRMTHVGDVRSLILHPPTTTHSKLSPAEREQAGIHPGLIRLSWGSRMLMTSLRTSTGLSASFAGNSASLAAAANPRPDAGGRAVSVAEPTKAVVAAVPVTTAKSGRPSRRSWTGCGNRRRSGTSSGRIRSRKSAASPGPASCAIASRREDGGAGASVRDLAELMVDIAAADSNVAQALRPGFLVADGLATGTLTRAKTRATLARILAGDLFAGTRERGHRRPGSIGTAHRPATAPATGRRREVLQHRRSHADWFSGSPWTRTETWSPSLCRPTAKGWTASTTSTPSASASPPAAPPAWTALRFDPDEVDRAQVAAAASARFVRAAVPRRHAGRDRGGRARTTPSGSSATSPGPSSTPAAAAAPTTRMCGRRWAGSPPPRPRARAQVVLRRRALDAYWRQPAAPRPMRGGLRAAIAVAQSHVGRRSSRRWRPASCCSTSAAAP